jgi:hypothetical protein
MPCKDTTQHTVCSLQIGGRDRETEGGGSSLNISSALCDCVSCSLRTDSTYLLPQHPTPHTSSFELHMGQGVAGRARFYTFLGRGSKNSIWFLDQNHFHISDRELLRRKALLLRRKSLISVRILSFCTENGG